MSKVAGQGGQSAATPNNLPHHLTSFVGREAELRSLKLLIRSSRMVTLTGAGGAGKSRLAAEVARAALELWPDGAWWVDLAPVNDVAGTVVATLELPGHGTARDVITSWLATRRAVLVLDNCEQLVAKCAAFCQTALERCPQLTIIATSRQPLGVQGEARWPVSSLPDPDALQLFQVRARLVSPDFKVEGQNLALVSGICDRLDRLPLAIEMAAAHLDVMSERELLANLNHRFRLLSSGNRTAPERQQTMVAAIDWSHRLLTEDEARLFRRLSVFRGGFTLEGIQAVCSELDAGRALEVLGGLVQKSMVVADRLDDGSTRYRLLESHHAYAAEKLREADELDLTQKRHYEYFMSCLETKTISWTRPQAKAHAPGIAQQRWKARESANLWAAVAWARDKVDDMGFVLALEVADSEYSDHARARMLLHDLLERSPARGALRAKALNLAARLASRQADHVTSRSIADASVALAREVGDPELIAHTLNGAGMVYHSAGELGVPGRLYEEALALLKGSSNRRLLIEVQNQRGWLAIEQGSYAAALEILEGCVAFSKSEGDQPSTARFLESQANAQLGLGARDGAAASWRESLSIYQDLKDPFGMIWCVGGLSLAAAASGDHERALRLAAVVDRMSQEWSLSALSFRITQLEQACQTARTRLGARKSEGIWNDGHTMSTQRALDYALTEDERRLETAIDAGPLSRREREVVSMVAAGMTNRQIAERLFIAERTAEGHVERIRNKLGMRSRTEVATWAVARGLGQTALDKASPASSV
jgi:predicted ATPase/DNA-binding CsgD family transcriptional regulator